MLEDLSTLWTSSAPVSALDLDVERSLILSAQSGSSEAVERLLVAYGPALRSAVARVPASLQEDARSAVLVEFVTFVQEIDVEAHPRLAGAIRTRLANAVSNVRGSDLPVSIPERTRKRVFGILREANGDPEIAASIAPSFGMSRETFALAYGSMSATALDETADLDGSESIWGDPEAFVEDEAALVSTAFAAVDGQEREVVRLAYGFADYEPQNDAEIAHRLGLTRPTVQRKRTKALDVMRAALAVAEEVPA